MSTKVTVIVPNYNKSIYLEQCIKSVAMQTYRPLEILVVDDASKDSSIELLTHLQKEYSFLKIVALKRNGGVSHARNVGIAAADGDIITFLDSDDYYINHKKIENEVKALEKSDIPAFSYSKTVLVDTEGNRINKKTSSNDRYLTGDILKDLLKCKCLDIVPRDYCIYKNQIENLKIQYNEQMNFFEDTDFLLKISAKAEAICTYEEGTAYRQNTNGLSNKTEKEQYRKRLKVSSENINLLNSYVNRLKLKIYLIYLKCFIELKLFIKNFIRSEDK